jgi:hypothetical protein
MQVDYRKISCHNCTNCFTSGGRPVCSELDFAIVGSESKCGKFEPSVLVQRVVDSLKVFSFVEVERRGQNKTSEIEKEMPRLQEV